MAQQTSVRFVVHSIDTDLWEASPSGGYETVARVMGVAAGIPNRGGNTV